MAPEARAPGPGRLQLIIELVVLFGAGPIITLAFTRRPIPVVIAGGLAVLVYLLFFCPKFDRARLWNWAGARGQLKRVLVFAAGCALLLTAFVLVFRPEQFLGFPLARPWRWLMVMALYPVLAAYPQELIFRAFIFQRYGRLFKDERHVMHLSAGAFAFAHVIYLNPLSMLLTLAGGYLFSYNYLKSRSLFSAALEHALYGCLFFTIGPGRLFYAGGG